MIGENRETGSVPARSIVEDILLFAACVVWFSIVATNRLIAKDEGFYVVAAQLVSEGRVPYLDFFYPQMPYLPYLYGSFLRLFGSNWEIARFVSVLLTAGCGVCLFRMVRSEFGRVSAYFGVLLFVSSIFVFPWFVTVQTYASSIFFLLASAALLESALERKKNSWICIAGLLFAVSVGIRLFFIGLLPLFIIRLLRARAFGWQNCKQFLVGFGLGMLPCGILFAAAPNQFLFNNLGYHLIRSGGTFFESLSDKWKILQNLLGLRKSLQFSGYQILVLVLGSALAVFSFRRVSSVVFISGLGAGLFLLHFLPSPNYNQYFCTVVPFFSIAVASLFTCSPHQLMSKWPYAVSILVVGLIYFWPVPFEYSRYTETGQGVVGIRNPLDVKRWRVESLTHLRNTLNELPPESAILSLWPGWLFGTRLKNFPGTENHFGAKVADRLSENERALYSVRSYSDERKLLRSGQIGYVLGERKMFAQLGFEKLQKFFVKRWSIDRIELWQRVDPAAEVQNASRLKQ